ncbi:MAG: enoyl-CoA hydratase/isomerase family protein [Betaproteobacteria bacterium]|nr:enoyl-CoA hydratase/isomerase family protein [Betaproteobacteria bacterium]MBI2959282.1 enoyl-CoA hydratase/isomerase family protein [Betaproteobacteria bacterium]
MSYKDLIYAVEEGIATITLNRPERMNALTPDMEAELHQAFDEADADRVVRVIILTGGGAAFSSGYSQDASKARKVSLDPTGKSIAEYIESWQRHDGEGIAKWTHMWRLGKPIIAAVNGWAMGGGFWYQLAADITIASDRAVFAQPEVRHISNSSYLFTALCGWKAANRWTLTGDHFDAEEAYRIGMVNQVVPHERLMEEARALARRIALVPEPAVRLNKAIAMLGMQAAGVHSGLLLEGALSSLAHASHNEYREQLLRVQRGEGTKAYLKLRDAPFQPEPMGPRSAKARQAKADKSGKGS